LFLGTKRQDLLALVEMVLDAAKGFACNDGNWCKRKQQSALNTETGFGKCRRPTLL